MFIAIFSIFTFTESLASYANVSGLEGSFSTASTSWRARASAPLPPSANASLMAKRIPRSEQYLRTSSISLSVSVGKRLNATTIVCPNLLRLSICFCKFASPLVRPSISSSFILSIGVSPCILSPCAVATTTVALGCNPLLRHTISKNFSAPRSAPNPASVIAYSPCDIAILVASSELQP